MQTKPPPGSKDVFSCTFNTALSAKTSEKKNKGKRLLAGCSSPTGTPEYHLIYIVMTWRGNRDS